MFRGLQNKTLCYMEEIGDSLNPVDFFEARTVIDYIAEKRCSIRQN